MDQSRFVVNGRPFNGTGIGYNETSGNLDYVRRNYRTALVVNPSRGAFEDLDLRQFNSFRSRRGAPDEGYDIPDMHNMFLATTPAAPVSEGSDSVLGSAEGSVPIPSFHRPALINYWYHKLRQDLSVSWQTIAKPFDDNGNPTTSLDNANRIADVKRHILMRPTRKDNPNFNGSNPKSTNDPVPSGSSLFWLWEIYGPWDVDNDGDGVPDSIWVDIGLPTKSTPDGRQYRPLVAYLCTDLDGRLNVNAHGREHPDGDVTDATGLGMGPPEIDVFQLPNLKIDRLFRGAEGHVGRYGQQTGDLTAQPPLDFNARDAFERMIDRAFFDYPQNYWNFADTEASAYGSPPDLHGVLRLDINAYGQPSSFLPSAHNRKQGTVYELDLSLYSPRGVRGLGARDLTFSIAEIEPILRFYDGDAGELPARLEKLTQNSIKYTTQVTTDSYDLPVPNIIATREMRGKRPPFPTELRFYGGATNYRRKCERQAQNNVIGRFDHGATIEPQSPVRGRKG